MFEAVPLQHSIIAGGENFVLTQALPHAEDFAGRRTPPAASTSSAALTAVPVAQPHAAAGTLSNPPSAIDHNAETKVLQQQTPAQQTDENAAASAGSPPHLFMRSHRHQGPILWGPSAADRLSMSIAAIHSHAGSTGTVGAGSLAQASAPLQPAITQGLRSSAAPPRSHLLGRSSLSPAPLCAARAYSSNAASSTVMSRAASSDTSPKSSETRSAANSPRPIINRSVAAARSPATSAYLPGFSADFIASAPTHRPRPATRRAASPTLPTISRPALSPEQAGVPQETGALLSLYIDLWVLSVCLLVARF